MRLAVLFPHLQGFRLVHQQITDGAVTLVVTPTHRTACCPHCHRTTRRVQRRYQRQVVDLPCAGRSVTLLLTARRFICRRPDCPPRTFREHVLVRSPTPHHIALQCLKHPHPLTPAQRTLFDQLCTADPAIASAYRLARQFATIAREQQGACLASWVAAATNSSIPDLRRCVAGLPPDKAAI